MVGESETAMRIHVSDPGRAICLAVTKLTVVLIFQTFPVPVFMLLKTIKMLRRKDNLHQFNVMKTSIQHRIALDFKPNLKETEYYLLY